MYPTEQVRQLERSIGLKDLAMAEMEEKIRNMEASTYDGVFIWKITEFARKRQEAITGRSPAIFSPGYCPQICKIAKAFCVSAGCGICSDVLSRGDAGHSDVLLFCPPFPVEPEPLGVFFSIGLNETAAERAAFLIAEDLFNFS